MLLEWRRYRPVNACLVSLYEEGARMRWLSCYSWLVKDDSSPWLGDWATMDVPLYNLLAILWRRNAPHLGHSIWYFPLLIRCVGSCSFYWNGQAERQRKWVLAQLFLPLMLWYFQINLFVWIRRTVGPKMLLYAGLFRKSGNKDQVKDLTFMQYLQNLGILPISDLAKCCQSDIVKWLICSNINVMSRNSSCNSWLIKALCTVLLP